MTNIFLKLEHVECANCGIVFGITTDFQQRRRNDHKGFYCPNGHSNVYNGRSAEEKLRDENERLQQRLNQTAARADQSAEELGHERRSKNAVKGHLTRTKNRISAGVCPCCNRSFSNLQRHMHTMHKDYAKKEEVA